MSGSGRALWLVVAAAALPLLLVVSALLLLAPSPAGCNPTGEGAAGVTVDPAAVTPGPVAGYRGEQLVNAAYVVLAGRDLGLGARDQTIGVMTAMGESGLRVLDYGDAVGPDSRGLFQQRDNGAWGSYADRMDPYVSATSFFRALARVEGRDALSPTIAAHRTQRNADPYHYERFWPAAVAVVEALAGLPTGLSGDAGGLVCTALSAGARPVGPQGWALPGDGPVTSNYGTRSDPFDGTPRFHYGVDLQAGGCGGVIRAARDGVVTAVYEDRGGNWVIELDHGGGISTRYLHM